MTGVQTCALPIFLWLKEVDFLPLTYAGDVYDLGDFAWSARVVLNYVVHNLALLAVPVALAALALSWPPRWMLRVWSRGTNPAVNFPQALNIWIIQVIVAIGPPIGGLTFEVYMKTDWGISLFFLTPLALVAIPRLRLPNIALFRIAVIWLVLTLATLAASPYIEIGRAHV